MTSNRTRIRWTLASAIGLLAVVQSLRTLPSLSSHAPLGAAALLALALLTVAGLVSLWNARRRIDRELAGMSERPAKGELVDARRTRLAQIAAGGGTPDLSALAEATAANERGQAYLGRYLVAVAVLIGLIGTFAGLAEALRALPAILGGASVDPQKLAALMSVPLAGLDVVFAAGIVGILSTLALSLAQGDLQLAEDGMLARLEEETTHELIPALWPRSHSVEERMLRELALLREENRTLLVEASAAIGARVAEVTAKSTTDMAARLNFAVEASTLKLAEEITRGFDGAMKAHADAAVTLRTDGAAQLATLKQSGEAMVQLAAKSASTLEAKLVTEAGHIATALDKTHTAQHSLGEALRQSAEQSALRVGERLDTLVAQLSTQSTETQRVLVEGAEKSGLLAASAVESLRATLAESLDATRVALTAELSSSRTGLVAELSSSRIDLVKELASSRIELVQQLDSTRTELGASLYAAADALRGEASSARVALEETTARAIASMEHGVETMSSVLGTANESMSAQVNASVETLTASTAAMQKTLSDGVLQAQLAIADGTSEAKLAIAEGASAATAMLVDSIARSEKALSDGALVLQAASAEELSATREALVTATHDAHGALGSALETALVRLEAVLATSRSELGETLGAGREAVDRLVADSVGALASSAATLAHSAETLSRTGDLLGPQLESLAPELRALSQEVALLGARTENTEEPLFADELVRLGEGMERLEALVKLAQHGESAQG